MQIEVWSDIVCPFCYIGKRRLETALEHFKHKEQVKIIYRSFELNPHASTTNNQIYAEALAEKYQVSIEQGQDMCDSVAVQAQEDGLTYHFETMIPRNTFDAHRLIHFAADQGKMDEMSERLFYAFFTETKNIADHDTLVQIATELGLDGADVLNMLTTDAYTKEVRNDELRGSELGINGVPYFIFDRKYAISGAQPVHVFEEVLAKVWKESSGLTNIASGGDQCTTDSCDVSS
ncbi:DsbA family oxidoreductase [Hazenella sp. IB182353]|uniref:DsbA family oxidoreductase n=1 Tax=Polycladospora coralii TaxID=2771432 RepID=UPI0017472C6C|nr:DsbA family oxidoreductase [Polycladospora coralii]MBS7530241.1 DsbA family oxidoreductase [Polycladospora coralii]